MRIRDVSCTLLGGRYPLIRVYADDGLVGIGEASPMNGPVVKAIVEHQLRPILKELDPRDVELCWERMYVGTYKMRGQAHSIAISGVDIALHDLLGKALEVPVYRLLGGLYRDRVRVYASYMSRDLSPAEYAQRAADAVGQGFTGVKIKIGARFGFDAGDAEADVALVREVRAAIGDKADLLVDANSGYSVHTAIRVGRELERYRVHHFEEPIPFTDVDGMAAIAAALDIPVAVGEQHHTRYDFKELLVRGAADVVQPDVTKCGGLSEGKKIAALADAFGRYVTTHTTSVGIGLAAHLHYWASTPACRYAQEFNLVASRSRDRILRTPLVPEQGYLAVPHGPGLGVELDEEVVARLSSDEAVR